MTRYPVEQLDLWAEPQETTQELAYSWADGDTDWAQLERLAASLLGTLQCERVDGIDYWLRITATRIADGRVWATYEESRCPIGTCQSSEEEEGQA